MTWRDLADFNFNSRFARKILGLYYRNGGVYRVPFGPLRGLKLIYDPKMTFHNILGLVDLAVFRALGSLLARYPLAKDGVAVDVGANRGLYSLWLDRTDRFKKVFSFEPNPALAQQLRRNRAINRLKNIEVCELACTNMTGQTNLYLGENDSISSVLREGRERAIEVTTTSLDEFFCSDDHTHQRPSFIKMDIEGGGVLALPGARKCLASARPLLYLESHSPAEDREIGKVLIGLDYQALRVKERKWVENADEVFPHPQGVWGNLIAFPAENLSVVSECLELSAAPWKTLRKAG